MKKLASRLPLQEMIASVIADATVKTASEESKVQKLLAYEKKEHGGHIPTPSEEEAEKEKNASAQLTNPAYIEKLASSVEFIASHFNDIEMAPQGVLQKRANEEHSPAGPGRRPGALEVLESIGGHQEYRKNHPKTEDAAASQAGTALSPSHEGDGKTQLENTMHHAPGQSSGSVPHAKYPAKGPLVAGPSASHTKTAGNIQAFYQQHVKMASPMLGGMPAPGANEPQGGGAPMPPPQQGAPAGGPPAAGGETHKHEHHHYFHDKEEGGGDPDHDGDEHEHEEGGEHGAPPAHNAPQHGGQPPQHQMPKMASPLQKLLLQKLAGEDVLKAHIEAERSASPLAGEGQLTSTQAGQASPHQAGDHSGGSFGNGARRLIASNQAAIDATKRDAKGPVKSQLAEVLEEPALSPSTDSKLEENLRNTGKAGVKIAGARAVLEKIAAGGCTCRTIDGECQFCKLQKTAAAVIQGNKSKTANAMAGYGGGGGGMMGGTPPPSMPTAGGMGGGMSTMAEAGAGADGCTCGGMGECRVCKLKAALAAAKAEGAGAGPMMAGAGGHAGLGEKDSGMGMAPQGGIY